MFAGVDMNQRPSGYEPDVCVPSMWLCWLLMLFFLRLGWMCGFRRCLVLSSASRLKRKEPSYATTITARKYQDITTCCRTSKTNWRPRIYSTTNPGGVGHGWYRTRFVLPLLEKRETET